MTHNHEHAATYDRAFAVGVGLNALFVVIEATFGVLSNSLALLGDAGHNLNDVLALLLAWGAAALSRRQPTLARTYGWRRSSILAALANALALFLVVGGVAWEAIRRLAEPAPVEGSTVIWVATVGIAINGVTAMLFMSGRKHDLNIRGAFLHMASDALVSLGVAITGVAIFVNGWLWLDPAVGLLIGAVILIGTWGLLRDSFNLALDAVPTGINPAGVQQYLQTLPGVVEVHDLHIWAMSTTETALSAHLVVDELPTDDRLLARIADELHDKFDIEHPTLQVERGDPDHPCALAPMHVV